MEVSCQLDAPAALPPGKEPMIPNGLVTCYWDDFQRNQTINSKVIR